MAWTQTDIDALKEAIASGLLSVQYTDKTIRYQSTQDQLAALAAMEAEVAGEAGSGSRSTFAGFQHG